MLQDGFFFWGMPFRFHEGIKELKFVRLKQKYFFVPKLVFLVLTKLIYFKIFPTLKTSVGTPPSGILSENPDSGLLTKPKSG
jgi:hypothetical protein